MTVLAIDPGTKESAYVILDGQTVIEKGHLPNEELLDLARYDNTFGEGVDLVAIEMIACYGMAVGKETFETCLLIGRLQEAFESHGFETKLIYRKEVCLHLCHSARAKDANIRQALIDKFGIPGTKKKPGGTYGITKHLWSALAIATYTIETINSGKGKGKLTEYTEAPNNVDSLT